MTSLARLLGPGSPDLAETRRVVADELSRVFGYPGWAPADPVEALAAPGRETTPVHSRG
jgi:hypothetical protein